jgi:hypothetical protein
VLGVPTVTDRVAQTVVAMFLEPLVAPRFHRDSYGYRPSKSAHDALAVCRQRCWRYDWVIDLDIEKFFDEVSWDLIVRAVKAVTDCPWVLLYVKRWLAAPLQHPDGALIERTKGTTQGHPARPRAELLRLDEGQPRPPQPHHRLPPLRALDERAPSSRFAHIREPPSLSHLTRRDGTIHENVVSLNALA